MADTPKKKKSPPKTAFEKIGSAYESEAKRQEKSGNPEMAKKTRQSAAKSMTPENRKALEESAQAAKNKKSTKKKGTSKKADAVEAAGAKAKDAVDAAKERNPIAQPASEGDKQGPPSPAGSKDNTGYGTSTQRTPKPSSKDSTPASTDDEGTPFDGDAYAKSKEGKASRAAGMEKDKNKTPLYAAEDADARSKSRARAYAGAQPPSFAMANNDITTEMPETRREKDEARTARIKELATSGITKTPNDKGEMPDDPKPRSKPTVLITPNDKGEMPDPNKPGFMSRLRSRMGSFTSRPGAPAATSTPPTPPSGGGPSGGGSTPPPPPPSGGDKGPATPAAEPKAEPAVTQTQDTQNGKQTQTAPAGVSVSFGEQAGGNQANVNSRATQGDNSQMTGGDNAGNDINKGNTHTQKINASYGPVTATTSGRATSSGKGGVTASTTGTASSHPRAQNASRGGRPTSRKK